MTKKIETGDEIKIDQKQVRQAFARAAKSYDEAAVLQREVNHHLLERLDYMKFSPESILDIGSGTGYASYALYERYSKASITALDLAYPMLDVARSRESKMSRVTNMLGKRRMRFVNAAAEQLPFADHSFDMLYSNLTVQWVNDLDLALSEFIRVLKPGGMLLFSTFGPDTLKELRSSWSAIDNYSHVSPFLDMHDVGDAMLRARLAEPVMDVENFTLTYSDVYKLMRDLKAIGAHNATTKRARGLTGKQHFKQLEQQYENFRDDGVLPATYEVVYGHAWKSESSQHQNEAVSISVEDIMKPSA